MTLDSETYKIGMIKGSEFALVNKNIAEQRRRNMQAVKVVKDEREKENWNINRRWRLPWN